MFREEVLGAQVGRTHGPILLVRPVASWCFVVVAAVIVVCLLTYLILGAYTKRITATGVLLPVNGMIRIVPPVAGVITERRVSEGQRVRKGDILFVLMDTRSQRSGSDIQTLQQAHHASFRQRRASLLKAQDAQRQLAEQTQQGLQQRLLMLRAEIAGNHQQIALQHSRVGRADTVLQRYRQLAQARFVSSLDLEEKKDVIAEQRLQLFSLQQQTIELKRTLAASEDDLRQLPVRTAQALAEIDRELGALGLEETDVQTHDGYAITAPLEGVVTSVTARVGQSTYGQALATVLPLHAPLEAQLYLPSRSVGFVATGQQVRLRYQAYPYQKFGQYAGVVTEVARSPISSNELPLALPSVIQEGVYRVTVQLARQSILAYGKPIALQPGMVLEADIAQDRRRLIEWLLEPLYGLHTDFN